METFELKDIHTAYFIGIGGIGISAIARMLLHEGKKVYGSDRSASKVTQELEKAGAIVFIEQKAENISSIKEKIDLFVYTVAIPEDSPELVAAKKSGAIVKTYPEMLGVISKDKYTIAISGTHGKTTTTAMVAKILIDAEFDPTVIVGSLLDKNTNFISGESMYLVVEADEYKKSFHHLHPSILLINNLDEDHLDFYKDLADIQDSFATVAKKLPVGGFLIANTDDQHVAPVISQVKEGVDIIPYQKQILEAKLTVPGEHNRSNARAAMAVADALNIPWEKAEKSLSEFAGVWRRFEYKGETTSGVTVYDDYAHNPQKLKALLAGAREYFGKDRRIVVAFQPHLYSRTKTLFKDFVTSFGDADVTVLVPIFPAREAFDPTISSDMLKDALIEKGLKEVYSAKDFGDAERYLRDKLHKDDVLITVGAGEAYKIGEALLGL